jgi:hypothetical protein
VGNWYWIVDEIEAAGCLPHLAHIVPTQHPLAPPARAGVRYWAGVSFGKNRMHSTLATPALPAGHRDGVAGGAREYALSLDTLSDIYAPKWRPQLMQLIRSLPDEAQRCMEQELELLDLIQAHIQRLETRILEQVRLTPTIQLTQSVPGPAEILSIVIERELGSIDRFRAAPRSAA